jgi:uncharacterized membrane protein (DUF485 family)
VWPVSERPAHSPSDLPTPPVDDEHPVLVAANARAGLWLFGLYLILYAGFVGLSAFAPGLMASTPLGGLNLAVLYGMGLIAAAMVLAMVYMGLCRWLAGRHEAGEPGR